MDFNENSPLLQTVSQPFNMNKSRIKGLSVLFAVICVVDVFGVFPIIALPRAIIQCGWLGIPLAIFTFSIQIYTATLLGKCWIIAEYLDKSIIAKNRYPYAAIAEMTFGTYVARIVTVLLDVTIFGGGIPNLLVAAQNLQLFGNKMSNNDFDFSFCYWMLILGILLCPFLWLGSPKDMKVLCSLSAVIVLTVSVMIWVCIFNDDTPQTSQNIIPTEKMDWQNIVSAYGILAFQFDIHPMVLTIQVDMTEKNKIGCVVFFGFLVTTSLFAFTTVLASVKYGINTYPNILQSLPSSLQLYVVVLLVTIQLCMTSAVSNSALYQHIEDFFNIPRDFNYKRCIIRSSLTALAVFVAESVPKFDLVMSLIGGTFTGPLVFIFPPLFYMKILSLKRRHISNLSLQTANHIMYHCETSFVSSTFCNDQCVNALKRQNGRHSLRNGQRVADVHFVNENSCNSFMECSLASFVILFGILATCATTYINIKDAIKYANFSPPCLYNLTIV